VTPPTAPIDTGAMSGGGSAMTRRVEESRVGDDTSSSRVVEPVEDVEATGASAGRVPSLPPFPPVFGVGP
jgi:hypothetical protein